MGRKRAGDDTGAAPEPTATEAQPEAQAPETQADDVDLSAYQQPQGANEDGSYIYHAPGGAGGEEEAGPRLPAGLPEGSRFEDREEGTVLVIPNVEGESGGPDGDSAEGTEETPEG